MDAAVTFFDAYLNAGQKVLIHCNQGASRSPSIAMLYLATHTNRLARASFEQDFVTFREVDPLFSPAGGVMGSLRGRRRAFPETGGE